MTNVFSDRCLAPRVLSRGSRPGKFTQYLALVLLGAFTGSAFAGQVQVVPLTTPLTYNDGDLFLGFRASDRNQDYLINIGQPTQFVNAAPGSTFSVAVGNTSIDLAAAFGFDWRTRIDSETGVNSVSWAVVGGRQLAASGDPANVLYSTNPSSTAWSPHSDTAQSFTSSLIAGMGGAFAGNNPTANNPQGLIQSVGSSNSYASFQPGGANSGGISFQTWNPWNEGAPAIILNLNRIAPGACATVLGTLTLDSSGQVSFTANLTPAPFNLAGHVQYCSNPGLPPVPGVTLTLTGSMSGSTVTDGSGNYTLSSLPPGGTTNYVVTPSKTALTPGSAGINTSDVIATQRHFLSVVLLTGCRLTAADVNGDSSVTTSDVIAIQRFFLNQSTGIANSGKYKFTPLSRTYTGLFCSPSSQNYDALVFGDVVTGFVHRPDGSPEAATADDLTTGEVPATVAEVALPEIAVDASYNKFIAQVTTSAIDAARNLVGFQGDFTFDERVVTFDSEPVQRAGLTGGNWNVSGNVLPGVGPIRTLRVSAYSNDFAPLSGAGTLFELKMNRVSKVSKGAPGTQLLWAAPPDHFYFIDADLNTQAPAYATPGSVTNSGLLK